MVPEGLGHSEGRRMQHASSDAALRVRLAELPLCLFRWTGYWQLLILGLPRKKKTLHEVTSGDTCGRLFILGQVGGCGMASSTAPAACWQAWHLVCPVAQPHAACSRPWWHLRTAPRASLRLSGGPPGSARASGSCSRCKDLSGQDRVSPSSFAQCVFLAC